MNKCIIVSLTAVSFKVTSNIALKASTKRQEGGNHTEHYTASFVGSRPHSKQKQSSNI